MRFIHCVREYNREHGTDLRTIALATDVDRGAMYVREADEVVWLGAPFFVDPKDQRTKSRYVDLARLAEAFREARADAAWLGWAFVPEHLAVAATCEALGMQLIGVEPAVMGRLRDKRATKSLAGALGIPLLDSPDEVVTTLAAARLQAEVVGYPLMLKTTDGGAGFGLAVVTAPEELEPSFERVHAEASRVLGHAECYLERYLPRARLISVEILADTHGNVWDVGVRDGSVQHGFAKFLDEAPPTDLAPELERQLRGWAVALMKEARYVGVGAVEFLLDERGRPWFLEVNARLETAHDVLEATTGIDLVKQEIFVARGGALQGPPPVQRGHAFQVRLQARDPAEEFRPALGVLDLFRPPTGPGIRVEASVVEGDELPPGFGTHIAKLVAYGLSRSEALARLERCLRETTVVLRGGATNQAFLLAVVRQPELTAGAVDAEWLDRVAATGVLASDEHAGAALAIAAIEGYEAEATEERAQFLASAARGRPAVRPEVGKTIELSRRASSYRVGVARLGSERYRIELGGRSVTVAYQHRGAFERRLDSMVGLGVRATVVRQERRFAIDVEGVAHRIELLEGGMVRAPAPGIVQSVCVEPGARVRRGDVLVVLEAMKTEVQVLAPFDGSIRQVDALPNVPVAAGAPLAFIEVGAESNAVTSGGPPVFPGVDASPVAASAPFAFEESVATLREAMLGYDVEAREVNRILAALPAQLRELDANDPEVLRLERSLVGVFADLVSLFRRRKGTGSGLESEDDGAEEHLITFLRARSAAAGGLPAEFLAELRSALAHYGVSELTPSAALDDALFWIFRARQRLDLLRAPVLPILERWLELTEHGPDAELRRLLDRLARVARGRHEAIADLALEVSYRLFARPGLVGGRRRASLELTKRLANLADGKREEHLRALVESPYPLFETLAERLEDASEAARELVLEALAARYYRSHEVGAVIVRTVDGVAVLEASMTEPGLERKVRLLMASPSGAALGRTAEALARLAATLETPCVVDLFVYAVRGAPGLEASASWPAAVTRVTTILAAGDARSGCLTLRRGAAGLAEDPLLDGIHPTLAERLQRAMLAEFTVERLPGARDVHLFRGVARANPKDERLFAFAEVDLTPVRDASGLLVELPHFERILQEALASVRSAQVMRPIERRLHWNRVVLEAPVAVDLSPRELVALSSRLSPSTEGAGLEKIVLRGRFREGAGEPKERLIELRVLPGMAFEVEEREPDDAPIARLSEYEQKVVRARQRGLVYPHELLRLLTSERGAGALPRGEFIEYDLREPQGEELAPVTRPPGQNTANLIVGLIRNFTPKFPEGMTRVVLLGDPSSGLGSLAEPECRRVLGALALATAMKVPVEWFALSSGAKISMDSGTENMDWIALVLRRLIEFTQAGGEVNVLVMGINVGGQPYWNAEATMLMHTRGILIMMPQSAMVLTGKRALDYSGGVSAEDDFGIGGYDRIMGVNGQAQYFAGDVTEACRILLRHYDHCYVFPGERFPRRATTTDPFDRDIGTMPHGGELATVADVFSAARNPGRKKPFHIRKLMAATIDQEHERLERWRDMRDAENAVVWDAHLGGYPVALLGIESEPLARRGPVPADGPESFTGGTLFPLASKKIARAINAASANRPVVVLANLSGFDGSPESMRNCQLELGAEIGRAVVNFVGPMVFCVVSRFHGGAYVVFSRVLNENLEVVALEGTFASVIGGAPAAGVVFAGEVDARAKADPRIKALAAELASAPEAERRRTKTRLEELLRTVRAEKVGQLAEEFDREHSVQRALRVGSLHRIIAPETVRPYLIDAIERGMARELQRPATSG